MNRYLYCSSRLSYLPLQSGQILQHGHVIDIVGKVSIIDGTILITYGRMINGVFINASQLENMMGNETIDYKSEEEVSHAFIIPKGFR
jgi:hypothetical protein